MAVVSRAIPTLLRGISQAADSTKQPDHADIQDNANSSPVRGLVKRSGTQFITSLSSSTVGNVHIQTINRDINERYIVVITNGNIAVHTVGGVAKTVVNQTNATNYLQSSNPREDFKCLTVNDFTFVLNKNKAVAMDSSSTSPAKVCLLYTSPSPRD